MKVLSFEIKDYIHSTKHKKKKRWFNIAMDVKIIIKTDCGVLVVDVKKCFETDGRSGGRWIDWLFPHWGNQKERACVLVHDVLYHDYGLTFETANSILYQMMLLSGIAEWRANLVYSGVSSPIAYKKFGNNTESEEDNKKLANVYWIDKI